MMKEDADIILTVQTTSRWPYHLSSWHFYEVGAAMMPILQLRKIKLKRRPTQLVNMRIGPRAKALRSQASVLSWYPAVFLEMKLFIHKRLLKQKAKIGPWRWKSKFHIRLLKKNSQYSRVISDLWGKECVPYISPGWYYIWERRLNYMNKWLHERGSF